VVRGHEAAIFGALEVGGGPVLEVGAGEGLTLRFRPTLQDKGYVVTDLHLDRARAARDGTRAWAAACDVTALPFLSGSLGTVLCRDVLHHLPPSARAGAVAEMARVLAPGGVLCVVEPNAARSPAVALFSALTPTERWALSFDATYLRGLVAPSFSSVEVSHLEPSMLYRVVLHHRTGVPALSRSRVVRAGLRLWERVAAALPASRWCYVRLVCRGPRGVTRPA
jgi:SAM-dependent methyltransferase